MSRRLVHVGSAVVDYVYRIDALPAPGTEKTATSYARVAGGGFNMMVAASRTGMRAVFGGQLGTGADGDFLRAAFAAEGIETLTPPSPLMDSGNCVAMISGDAERTFVSWPGAESHLTLDMMAPVQVAPGDWVFASGYTLSYPGSRDVLADWIEALPAEVPFVLDPTPVVAEIPRPILDRVLARTTWLSCNTDEAAEIAGSGDAQTVAIRILAEHCPKAAGVVIRAGARGCLVRQADGGARAIPGFEVAAVDTNGAGDTHIGAFVSALSRGQSPCEAARYANAAAALAVTRHGGSSAPTDQEIQEFLSHRDQAAHGWEEATAT
ncbi:ribokinase [Mesorhizobium sp. M1C.F.Ca.ET.193.01.1.1]|uniref:PfkB family carbohydrate kinase n=1 Tax=unclassified Mesorhizobium TaxID=325217 RepID=UPI000FD1AE30|nr:MULTISPECIES: PfkB family carbohydrate kinase [unclassified Mesorhizobium]TGS98949.1 ribokinase [bacterium M00.F.Ca.ET.177.01.1.1]TGQ52987.1 ribokinase [Mesorhizobium sp. M1C.F.Ca.ET.210.01.1.1]TGQ70266.1 ribokinase [Mesorhizobium sp. M1C.F.Ca.ET.212.01.1.1]TGR06595.1 ribokinase [Mesorhizobium sp. M1C.F.Ca.ET.204.01.1.1]TGR27118.1 ribokinase [Mesorhizobium sp. M1C.F.Ca.ET.196.01.1.1]